MWPLYKGRSKERYKGERGMKPQPSHTGMKKRGHARGRYPVGYRLLARSWGLAVLHSRKQDSPCLLAARPGFNYGADCIWQLFIERWSIAAREFRSLALLLCLSVIGPTHLRHTFLEIPGDSKMGAEALLYIRSKGSRRFLETNEENETC